MKDALGDIRSILVLGGGSEIALATARAAIARRARTVILAGRDLSRLEVAAGQLRRAGADNVETVRFDALDTESHAAFVDDVFNHHADIDLVLLAFGVLGEPPGVEPTHAVALDVVRTNFLGAVSVTLPLVPRLRQQGHGTIAVLSSVAGERGRRSNYVYGSSKAGLDTFAQGLGDALYDSGVHVMVVRAGFVRTRMTAYLKPAPLSTTPDAVAASILDGLRDQAHTIWAPPALRWVMSVVRHLPRTVFRRLKF